MGMRGVGREGSQVRYISLSLLISHPCIYTRIRSLQLPIPSRVRFAPPTTSLNHPWHTLGLRTSPHPPEHGSHPPLPLSTCPCTRQVPAPPHTSRAQFAPPTPSLHLLLCTSSVCTSPRTLEHTSPLSQPPLTYIRLLHLPISLKSGVCILHPPLNLLFAHIGPLL